MASKIVYKYDSVIIEKAIKINCLPDGGDDDDAVAEHGDVGVHHHVVQHVDEFEHDVTLTALRLLKRQKWLGLHHPSKLLLRPIRDRNRYV